MTRCLIAALVAVAALAPINSNAVSQDNSDSYSGGAVAIEMNRPPGAVLNPGDEIGFRLASDTDAYVIVFNIDTDGFVNLLYPAKGERPARVREGETYLIPDDNSELLLVEGRTGVEFLFVLVVPERDDIDRRELDFLGTASELPPEERYRIDGDPFIAANIIAGELVRGISRREGVFFDYTYFFINERVSYPCYLCGECDGAAGGGCEGYIVTANFDRNRPLTYPMRRGYEMIEPVATPTLEGEPGLADAGDDAGAFGQYESDDGTVNINFYPYSSEVYYETRETLTKGTDVNVYLYGDPYYNPWYYGWYYYPTVSVGFYWGPPSFWWGFNWGWWGGYYCSAWYWPRCYTVYDYYCHYGYHGGYRYRPERYKDKYYAGDTGNRRSPYKKKYQSAGAFGNAYTQAAKRDSRMKVASSSVTRSGSTKYRSKTRSTRWHGESVARGAKSIGKTTRVRNFGDRSASRAKFAYRAKTRSSYTPKTRRSYGISSRDSKSRGVSTLRPRDQRTGTYRYPAYRSGKSSGRTRGSGSAYDGRSRSTVPKSRTSGRTYKRPSSSRSKSSAVKRGRSSSNKRARNPGYKPTSRSNRPSGKSSGRAVKPGRSGSRPSARGSGARRSSGGRARSGGKGRR